MALYRYVKTEPAGWGFGEVEEGRVVTVRERVVEGVMAWWGVAVAAVMILVGGGLLSFSLAPIVAYEFLVAPKLVGPLVSGVVEGQEEQRVEGISASSSTSTKGEAGEMAEAKGEMASLDLTRPDNWFPNAPQLPAVETKVIFYNLTVPKLGIYGATVEIGGDDLSDSLIHYQGTALPGQPGNSVVFGHSVLPQFYNPENYMTIFSTLPTLEEGDEVWANFDGITYRYQIMEMFEVKPADIQIMEQKYDDSYLTLVTCVPPGTYLRRLVVRARLVNL